MVGTAPTGARAFRACLESLEPRTLLANAVLEDVPEYVWQYGCGPTAAGMVLGYWDAVAYPNYFPGDAATQTAAVNDRIASPGHIADYYPTPDAPLPHHADNSIADFMYTSRNGLEPGWSYYSYIDNGVRGYSSYVGYPAGNSWNELFTGTLTFSGLAAQIDAGRPAILSVDSDGDGQSDHIVTAVGYRDDAGPQVAVHVGWLSMPGVRWLDWRGMSAGTPWGIYGATFFVPSPSAPDLVGASTLVTPSAPAWGGSVTYDYAVKNWGQAAAGASTVRFYLSADAVIGAGDVVLGTASAPPLAAGAQTGGQAILSLPANPPPGFGDQAWIGMIVDADAEVAESVEGNNANVRAGRDGQPLDLAPGEIPATAPAGWDAAIVPDADGDWYAAATVSPADPWQGWLVASETGGPITLTVTGTGVLPAVGLYNAQTLARVAGETNASNAAGVALTATLEARVRYLVLVTGKNGAAGEVKVSADGPSAPAQTLGLDAAGSGTAQGQLSAPAQTAYVRFTAPAIGCARVIVTLSGAGALLRAALSVWQGTEGIALGTAQAATAGQDVVLVVNGVHAGGTYELAVSGVDYAAGSGGYTLTIVHEAILPGDANLDGSVDLQDFGLLKFHFSEPGIRQWSDGDFNGDGTVDLQDFGVLRDHFGLPAEPAGVSPAPSVSGGVPAGGASAPAGAVPAPSAPRPDGQRDRDEDDLAPVLLPPPPDWAARLGY